MGILYNGIFGGFSNKTGPLVGRKKKGQHVITGLHHVSTREKTAEELAQTRKLTFTVQFLKNIKTIIAIGFNAHAKKCFAFNKAVSYHLKHVVRDIAGNYTMYLPALTYSRGNLQTGVFFELLNLGNHVILFKWKNSGFADLQDKATFLIYNEPQHIFLTQIDAARRYEEAYSFILPAGMEGNVFHAYMSFRAANGKAVSDTVYLGTLRI